VYGEILKSLRIEKGLTQQQLAEILGFKSASAVGMIEREERELSVDTIIHVTNYFNVSSDYLMGLVPFKNETEAYHSISVAAIKHLHENPHVLPYKVKNYVDYDAVYGNKIDEEIKAYCDGLISKYDRKLTLTDLELFELSNILFLSVKWSPDYNGLVYLQPFNEKYLPFSLQLDFKKIDKVTLDLIKSTLINYKAGNNTFVKYTSVLEHEAKEQDSYERVTETNDDTINLSDAAHKRIKEVELLEDFEEPDQALKFILTQPMFAAYGGYDLENMSDEEIIEIANDMLFAMRLSLEKLRKKNK
jgi:transcriptional regulator with XRE-family HTH domain